jgi:nitrile hydratase
VSARDHEYGHDHAHDHGHDHDHDGGHHPAPLSDVERRVGAMEALLVEKGLVTTDAIDAVVEHYEHDLGPMLGAQVVARAWTDPGYRERLLANGTAAIAELGFGGAEGECMVVLENTPEVHNVVVCTLCSCYPWPVLGLPPRWYKSSAYRSRVVREPRAVLAEFGTVVPDDVEVRVWDSSAEIRYLVLPLAPPDAAQRTVDELAAEVSRDHMIGVAR